MNTQARDVKTGVLVAHLAWTVLQAAVFIWAAITENFTVAIFAGFGLIATAIGDVQDTILGELRGENRRRP